MNQATESLLKVRNALTCSFESGSCTLTANPAAPSFDKLDYEGDNASDRDDTSDDDDGDNERNEAANTERGEKRRRDEKI